MKDLIIYGNLIRDKIHLCEDEFVMGQPNNNCHIIDSVGGIGNHVKTIELTGLDLSYSTKFIMGTEYDPISQATVIVDKKDGKKRKTSSVKWGADTRLSAEYIQHESAQWHHISYLDALPKITVEDVIQMGNSCEFVSVDFCGANFPYDERIFNWLDFIITSDTEINKIPPHLHHKCIIHSPTETIYFDEVHGFQHIKNPIPFDEDICILGAGDAYCVSFIFQFLKTRSMKESIKFAHTNAYKYLVLKFPNNGYEEKIQPLNSDCWIR